MNLLSQLHSNWTGKEEELSCSVKPPFGFEFSSLLQDTIEDRVFGCVELQNSESHENITVLSNLSISLSLNNQKGETTRTTHLIIKNPQIDLEKMPEGSLNKTTGVVQSVFWNTIPFSTFSK